MIALPPEDRALSPHTGYTRAHWEAVADRLLNAAWRWASPHGARLDLPGRPSANGAVSDGLEGYARTFLAAAFRVAGGGDPRDWLGRYAEGLVAGTKEGPEEWPPILDYHDRGQPMVESASIALGLRLTRPWLWDRLDGGEQDRVEEWLRGALRHVPAPNNWYLFPFTVAGFLESVGRGDAETARARTRALDLLEVWYRGQGWYSDGDGRAFDHYNGWALHLYPVLDNHLSRTSTQHDDRLREHLETFSRLFGDDGAPLHFGRSLTYRFAAASAVALGAVTGHTPLAPGVSRRLLSGSLRYFLDRGAVDANGLLTLGWHGPHEPTLQFYSGPASPYWASKAFVGLLAPADHPLWTDIEGDTPGDAVFSLPKTGFLVQSAHGVVRLHNHGSDHVRSHEGESAADDDPHYGRQAYSTSTGPSFTVADNHFAVVVDGVRSVRRRVHPLGAGHGDGWGWAASSHLPAFTPGPPLVPGLRVESVTVAVGPHELRAHRVIGAPPDAVVEQTGWAAPDSTLHPLHGWAGQDEIPTATAFTDHARVRRLTGPAHGTALHAAFASLTPTTYRPTARVTGTTIEVDWPDGSRTTVDFEPLTVRRSRG
ncbi:DUF2264 domain-containing protein [Umezawaea sp. NPDC059074]|uniref:DUF2264 domain-containing protein n=1 Tax=Umezawaea sp. NPDC059074 TaxID=3346716 RepID=UPI0036CDFA0B